MQCNCDRLKRCPLHGSTVAEYLPSFLECFSIPTVRQLVVMVYQLDNLQIVSN
jgi:hypothetical protein